jgi:lysozyme
MKPITKMSNAGKDLLAQWEGGHELTAYLCPAKVWTISVGVTHYGNGKKVQEGDTISMEDSIKLFDKTLLQYEKAVYSLTRDDINQNQFDALVSFAYNVGIGALQGSTLLKKVNKMPDDVFIADEFMKWVYAAGRIVNGLVNRRKKEIALYFKPVT